jgi:TM2 domain-containing membrane protein YozV
MKSKSTAYLLWFFTGLFGGHLFYLEKTGKGVLYLFTFGLLGIGAFIDLFTLGGQVETFNAMYLLKTNALKSSINNNNNNIVVNIPHAPKHLDISEQLHKLMELKEKGILSEEEFAIQKAKALS